jgi:hypothetical protein
MGFVCRRNHACRVPTRHVALAVSYTSSPAGRGDHANIEQYAFGSAVAWRLEKGHKSRDAMYNSADQRPLLDWIADHARDGGRTILWGVSTLHAWALCDGWRWAAESGWTVKYCSDSDRATIVELVRGTKKLVLIDLHNFWPTYRLPASSPATQADIIRETANLLMRWWKGNDLGNWRNTASGLAWQSYRHSKGYIPHESHCVPNIVALERAAYHGGVCRCRVLGTVGDVPEVPCRRWPNKSAPPKAPYQGRVYHLDCTGSYAAVMAGTLYPTRLVDRWSSCSVEQLDIVCLSRGVVAAVKIEGSTTPHWVETPAGPRWATGSYWTVLPGPELHCAIASGFVCQVGRVAIYDRAYLFDRWVTDWWTMRMEARNACDQHAERLCKMMPCALYGRFAARQPVWQPVDESPEVWPYGQWTVSDEATGEIRTLRSVNGVVQEQITGRERKDTLVAVSAYITSYQRLRMRYLQTICGQNDWLYSDTDSLHVTEEGYKRLLSSGHVDSNVLGHLRLCAQWDWVIYHGQRDYETPDGIVCAGVDLDRDVYGKLTGMGCSRDSSASIIRRGPNGLVRSHVYSLIRTRAHPGGILREDGYVDPWHIGEEKHDDAERDQPDEPGSPPASSHSG